jgi:tryptophan 2,3-dioxygenase
VSIETNTRELDTDIVRDSSSRMSYVTHLQLPTLRNAAAWLRSDDLGSALQAIARVKDIQKTLTEQWSVLATLAPTGYSRFRGFLKAGPGGSSGAAFLRKALELASFPALFAVRTEIGQ